MAIVILASALALLGCAPAQRGGVHGGVQGGVQGVRAVAAGTPTFDPRPAATPSTVPASGSPGSGSSVPTSGEHPLPPDTPHTQYVVISFDGSGTSEDVKAWRELGARTGARFTFFVSGVYYLPYDARMDYYPPHHDRGYSAIGFIQRPREQLLLPELQAAYDDGNEIGSHFNGHFCSAFPGGVGTWTAADWASEVDQYDEFMSTAGRRVGVPGFQLTPDVVVGERTPCLEGDLPVVRRVLKARGYRYDASGTATLGPWPTRAGGLWEFPLQVIPIAGMPDRGWLSMDYNFLVNLAAGALTVPAGEAPLLRRTERLSYENALTTLMHTTHAPLFIGAHFESWDANAYTDGLRDFVADECTRPQVACVSFEHLASVLDARGSGPGPGRGRVRRAGSTAS